jgi:succinate dehydrogenase/fumarate reductase cytochrome b subunit
VTHFTLKRIHRGAAILLSVFIVAHLVNHIAGLAGPALHQSIQESLRKIYRFAPIEVALLLAVGTQMITGLSLVIVKKRPSSRYDWMQLLSGLYLAFFLCFHLRAVMLARFEWNVETDFHFAAWGIHHPPNHYFFVPYYGVAVFAVFLHVGCAHRLKMMERLQISSASDRRYGRIRDQFLTITISGAIVSASILMALHCMSSMVGPIAFKAAPRTSDFATLKTYLYLVVTLDHILSIRNLVFTIPNCLF